MTRRLSRVAVLLAAVSAIAAAPSVATAASQLTVGSSPAIIEGTQTTTQKIILGEGITFKCTTSVESATTSSSVVKELVLTPEISGCTLGAEAVFHKCTYSLMSTATALTDTLSITNCPATAPWETRFNSTGCVITIANQGPLSSITFSNTAGPPSTVTETLNVKGLAYTGSSNCWTSVVGSHTDGEWIGSYLLKAYKDESGKKGAQVSLSAD